MDWSTYYPAFVAPQEEVPVESGGTQAGNGDSGKHTKVVKLLKNVEVADIGCGFGGLLVALAPKLPDKLLLGASVQSLFF